jgi:ferredoxin-NADP reductase/MOSC domain-containing protein YiiM
VYVYQLDSYRHWRDELGRDDFVNGQFGENFTVDGLGDDEVCIGDRYRIGGGLFEVTQPRVTCYRVGIRMNEPRMPALLTGQGRPGFYFRVLEEGVVQAGDDIVKVADGPERMTVAAVNALLYVERRPDPTMLERALRIAPLSPGWQTSLRALLEQARGEAPSDGNAGLTSAGPPPAWPGFRPLRVVALHSERANALSVELGSGDGSALAGALPGQFVTLKLDPGRDAPPLLRSYSLSGAPGGAGYRITVKIEPHGAAGRLLRDNVRVGDEIQVAAPRGQFTLDDGSGPVVLVSAGVGVTPVLAMLYALRDARSQREIWWLHGARNSIEHIFAEEARGLMGSLANGHLHVWYSQPGPDDRVGVDYDELGRMTPDSIVATGVPIDAELYLCGPQSFMDEIRTGLETRGMALPRIHTETFGAESAITPGVIPHGARAPHPPDRAAGTGPRLSFARSGLNVHWSTEFSSILELAEACDVPVRWSCRTGVCHTCETRLLDGEVAYTPDPLEPPATGNVLLCCTRPETDVALDL